MKKMKNVIWDRRRKTVGKKYRKGFIDWCKANSYKLTIPEFEKRTKCSFKDFRDKWMDRGLQECWMAYNSFKP